MIVDYFENLTGERRKNLTHQGAGKGRGRDADFQIALAKMIQEGWLVDQVQLARFRPNKYIAQNMDMPDAILEETHSLFVHSHLAFARVPKDNARLMEPRKKLRDYTYPSSERDPTRFCHEFYTLGIPSTKDNFKAARDGWLTLLSGSNKTVETSEERATEGVIVAKLFRSTHHTTMPKECLGGSKMKYGKTASSSRALPMPSTLPIEEIRYLLLGTNR